MTRPALQNRLCDSAESQLVVVDIQTRLAGAMQAEDRVRVMRNAGILIQAAGLLDVPLIASEQYPRGLGPTEEEVAWHFPKTLEAVEKTCFACSGEPAFSEALNRNGKRQVILAGMEAHVCVLQTALGLQADGYAVFVVEDAVCSRNESHRRNALERLRQAGVVVTNVESVLFEWIRDARHGQFKAVSALVR